KRTIVVAKGPLWSQKDHCGRKKIYNNNKIPRSRDETKNGRPNTGLVKKMPLAQRKKDHCGRKKIIIIKIPFLSDETPVVVKAPAR
ncbi:hypothetical protein, partial [Escherichia coli]|uniref:hypothetical protein n=1 Tax=Escherichia coli TaxID=562 RepID=UPI0032DA5902